jgi:hypothetical protein
MRKISTRDKIRKTPDGDIHYCDIEEYIIELVDRQRRIPTIMTTPDGFPPGGTSTRGGSTATTTEAAALALTDDTYDHDIIGPTITLIADMLDQAGRSANAVRNRTTEIRTYTEIRKSAAKTVEICCEEDCDEIAVPGGKGRCEADRKWLEREHTKAVAEGREPTRTVPRKIIAERKTKPRRQHENGPLAEGNVSS